VKKNVRNQLLALITLCFAGGILVWISMGNMDENLVYYWEVNQLLDKGQAAHGATVRLGGVVKPSSLKWDPELIDLRFEIAKGVEQKGQRSVKVIAKEAPPQMFREGIGVVVEGVYDGRVFTADRVIVKHSNEYRPPAEGEKPEQVYRTLMNGS